MIDSALAAETPAPQPRHFPVPPPIVPEQNLTPLQWGMLAFLCSEVAFFSTLIVAYGIFFGRDQQPGGLGGPAPLEVLSLPLALATTTCLLFSSGTIHLADLALRGKNRSRFLLFWAATIVLGFLFLCGTAYEWHDLLYQHNLTMGRNLFGTTFYTLVGFHALHVTGGVIAMALLLLLVLLHPGADSHHAGAEVIGWYWHFVDVVWLAVFGVVYLLPHLS